MQNPVTSPYRIIFGSLLLASLALAQHPDLKTGPNSDLGGVLLTPANDEWNRDVSKDPADPRSELSYATTLGYQGNSGGHMSLFPPQKELEWFRPFTALGTAAVGERRMGRFLTQSLEPVVPGRLSQSQSGSGMVWSRLPGQGTAPKGGLIAVCGGPIQRDNWWFVHFDGLYFSAVGGATLTKILDAKGTSTH